MAEIYLVRHAQASFGSENYDQLSALGYQQSLWLGEYFAQREIAFDLYLIGAQHRHRQTLEGVVAGLTGQAPGSYQIHTHTGLNEFNFERLMTAFSNGWPEHPLVQTLRSNPTNKKDYFRLLRQVMTAWADNRLVGELEESWQQFQQRVIEAQRWLQAQVNRARNILVISSGGAISMFNGEVLGLSPEKIINLNLQIRNTSVSHYYFNRSTLQLSVFNALPHLERNDRKEAITYG